MESKETFGPAAETILSALLEKPFKECNVSDATAAGVDLTKVALIELKLWMDFAQAIGELSISKDCIECGRARYFKSVVKFLSDIVSIEEALKRSQICTTRAAVNIATICADEDCTVISVDHYERGCDQALHSMASALKKVSARERKLSITVPLCEDAAKLLVEE